MGAPSVAPTAFLPSLPAVLGFLDGETHAASKDVTTKNARARFLMGLMIGFSYDAVESVFLSTSPFAPIS